MPAAGSHALDDIFSKHGPRLFEMAKLVFGINVILRYSAIRVIKLIDCLHLRLELLARKLEVRRESKVEEEYKHVQKLHERRIVQEMLITIVALPIIRPRRTNLDIHVVNSSIELELGANMIQRPAQSTQVKILIFAAEKRGRGKTRGIVFFHAGHQRLSEHVENDKVHGDENRVVR